MNRVTLRIVSNIVIGYWNVNATDWPPTTPNVSRLRPTARMRTGEARTPRVMVIRPCRYRPDRGWVTVSASLGSVALTHL